MSRNTVFVKVILLSCNAHKHCVVEYYINKTYARVERVGG